MASLLWILILVALSASSGDTASTDTLMSGLACNAAPRYTADCNNNSLSLIAPVSLQYGAKPLQFGCQGNSCCLMDQGRDCTFQDDIHLDDVIQKCSGNLACFVSPVNLRPTNCQYPKLFPERADYTYMEYACISVGHLRDVCHQGFLATESMHHVASNIYYNNSHVTNRSCSCQASTRCGAQVVLKAVDVRLSRGVNDTCTEILNIADGLDPNVNKTITCQDRQLYAWREVFRSNFNRARISMDIGSSHKGKLWMVIESSDPTAKVELACGRVQTVDPLEENQCPTTTAATTTTTTITTTATTTTATTATITPSTSTATPRSDGREGTDDNQRTTPSGAATSINPGVIAGAVIGSLLIVALLVTILIISIFILRNRRSQHMYENSHGGGVATDPDYDNFGFTGGHFEPIYSNNFSRLNGASQNMGIVNPVFGTELKTPLPDTPPPLHFSPPLPLTPAPSYHVGEPYINEDGVGEDEEEFQEVDEESFRPSTDNRANESQESSFPLARDK